MAGSSSFTVPILESNNFDNWLFRLTTLFKRDQCEEALEAPPVETDSIEIKNKFQRADAKAQAIIVQGITDKHLDIIKDSKSAREQLKALKDVFVRTSSFTKLSLWRKLINLKLGVNEKLDMDNIKILPNPVSVYIANGEILKTNKLGILTARCQGHIVNIEALIVPKIKHNLISASKMTSKGHKIIVGKRNTIIKGHNFELKCENKSGLYILNLDSIIEKNENCHAIIDEQIWHKRLGHAGKDALRTNMA
ncbi:hypothetical protein QE152_g29486 [Popillia japonica]|uniref:GAG-pre-integrase domain-containing protein n=1 Tax=Popillia japonica TaxID=7064 RepID=A0AAW1JHF4_POPJA